MLDFLKLSIFAFFFLLLVALAIHFWYILLVIILIWIIFEIYIYKYFKSENFLNIRNEVEIYIKDCNELNEHIESLKDTELIFNKTDYGNADVKDTSKYNMKRSELKKFSNSKKVYNCSLSVCKNAQNKPFEYVAKYFNIDKDENSLNQFEEVFNNFLSVEQGVELLKNKRTEILEPLKERVPKMIQNFALHRLEKKLGFKDIDFSKIYYPKYTLQYISDGGYASMKVDVEMNLENLEKFNKYLSDHIKWRKSIAGQRALMTPKLREEIKTRDNYTCKMCSNSTEKEPNLLLEIDHIIPLAKNGITSKDNLQTLCWRCNRTKGAKII